MFAWIRRTTLATLLFAVSLAQAQGDLCPTFIEEAIDALGDACLVAGRNQACYGNNDIAVTQVADSAPVPFAAPGDLMDVALIETLGLAGYDEASEVWGAALLRLQANLPDMLPGQNLSVLVFGDTQLQAADATWNAFYLAGGITANPCRQAPDGILIQTPEGVGEVQIGINGIEVKVGSTLYIRPEPLAGEDAIDPTRFATAFYLLEGDVELSAEGEAVTLAAGDSSRVLVEADADGVITAIAAPSAAEAFEAAALPELPPIPTEFADAESASTAEGAASANNGDCAIPRNGAWEYAFGDAEAGTCPAEFANAMLAGLREQSGIVIDAGEVFSALSLIDASVLPPGFSISNPEPCVYTLEFAQAGSGTFLYSWRTISASVMEGSFTIGIAPLSCEIVVPFTLNYAGG